MKRAALTIATLLLLASASTAQNTVTDWNEIGITAARASTAPGSATAGGTGIYMAYVDLAVYNAVNAIDGRFEPYTYSLTAPAGALPPMPPSSKPAIGRCCTCCPTKRLFLQPSTTTPWQASLTAMLRPKGKCSGWLRPMP